jgi:hypothetical protein
MTMTTTNTTSTPKAECPARPDRAPETERSVSEHRFCAGCGVDLTGRRRQARFCSDRCRTDHYRRDSASRIATLVDALEQTVATLKAEMGHE